MTWVIEENHKLPIYIPDKDEMTREEFLKFCAANSHLRIERDENNQILIMPPVFGETGRKHIKMLPPWKFGIQIQIWGSSSIVQPVLNYRMVL